MRKWIVFICCNCSLRMLQRRVNRMNRIYLQNKKRIDVIKKLLYFSEKEQ